MRLLLFLQLVDKLISNILFLLIEWIRKVSHFCDQILNEAAMR